MDTEKLDLKSQDLVNENFEKLATLFPNYVTEGKAIDFDLLKQELSHAIVEGNKERYRLEWSGKREANDWGVKQMRTKWETCNIKEKKIWESLELAKKPKNCLEYIIVHELIHLSKRNHNNYLNQFMPKWRTHRDELNSLPVSHNDWGY